MDYFFSGQEKNIQSTFPTNNGVTSTINQLSMNVDNVINYQNVLSQQIKTQNRANYNDMLMQKSFVNQMNPEDKMNKIYQQQGIQFSKENMYEKEKQNMGTANVNPIYGYNNQIGVGIHPVLEQFNKQLQLEEGNKEVNENVEKNEKDLYKNDMQVIIDKMESQDDPRMKNSKFLNFIKDLNNDITSFDTQNNTITSSNNDTTQQVNKDQNAQMSEVWNKISSKIDSLPPHLLSLNPSQYLPEAQKLLQSHNYQTAISLLNAYLQHDNTSLESIYTLAKAYMDIGRTDLTLSTLNSNVSLTSNHIPSLLLQCMCHANEGNDHQTISSLISIISQPQYNISTTINTNMYLNKSFIEQYLNPDNINITNSLSYGTYEQHRQTMYKELSSIFETILEKEQFKNDSNIILSYGILNMLYEKLDKVEQLFIELTELNKNDYTTWNRLGVLYANNKQYEKAIEMYMKALAINPQYVNCLSNIGIAYLNSDNLNVSARYFIKALQIYEDIPEIWNYLTGIFLSMERDDLVNLSFSKDINNIVKIFNIK